MPASRPIWKGQLRLSLVSIAVELHTATKFSARPSFRQIHEPTESRPSGSNVVDLMAALKSSLEGGAAPGKTATRNPAAKKPAATSSSRNKAS